MVPSAAACCFTRDSGSDALFLDISKSKCAAAGERVGREKKSRRETTEEVKKTTTTATLDPVSFLKKDGSDDRERLLDASSG